MIMHADIINIWGVANSAEKIRRAVHDTQTKNGHLTRVLNGKHVVPMEYLGNVLQARIADISSKSNPLSSMHNDIVKPGSTFNDWGTITAQVKAVVKLLLDVDTKPLKHDDK